MMEEKLQPRIASLARPKFFHLGKLELKGRNFNIGN
jgi:hypothetical protein